MYAFHNHYCFRVDIFLVCVVSNVSRSGNQVRVSGSSSMKYTIVLSEKEVGPCSSKFGLWTSCLITAEPIRSTESQVPHLTSIKVHLTRSPANSRAHERLSNMEPW